MAVYPLTMIPRFRKRNRERERAVTRQIEFHGKFSASPLPWKRHSNHYRTNFEAMFECPRSPSWLNWKILFSSLIIRTHIHICIYIYKNIFVILHRRGKRKAAFVSFRMWNRRRRKQSWCKLCQMYYLAYARLLYLIHSQDGKQRSKCVREEGRFSRFLVFDY